MAIVPGSNLGPYRIIAPLGRGGMASVYRAFEAALDRDVALKVLPREFLHDPDFAERFKREAKAIAKLEHPNIVPIYAYDIDRAEGIPWMALRLVGNPEKQKGGALSQLLKRGPLAAARAVQILRGVADALDFAHKWGVVHRDVKPQNLLLDEDGRVYLADFGIAKMFEASGGLTATGMITGTPQYMAPEQATGKKVGPAADIYALGIVAYEMFTGAVPFAADTPVAIMIKHMQEPLPIPPASALAEPLLRPLLKCTAKTPEARWASAGAFVSALEAALDVPTAAIAEAPTSEVSRASAPTTVGVPTAVSPSTRPAGTALTRPAGAPTVPAPAPAFGPTVPAGPPPMPPTVVAPLPVPRRPQPPSPPPASMPTPARSGVGPLALLALAGLGLVVLAAAAVGAWLLLRGPAVAPTPPPVVAEGPAFSVPRPAGLAASATPQQPSPQQPTPAPATPAPATPGGTAASPTAPRREPVPATPAPASARNAPAPVRVAEPLPVPTPVPTPRVPALDPQVQQLVAALGGSDTGARWRAAQALGSMGSEAAPAVPSLATTLGDRSAEVRWRSAEALGLIGASAHSAVPALARALSDSDPIVRTETIKALGLLGPAAADAVTPLAQALTASDVSIRREAARALGRLGTTAVPALRPLLEALKDKDKFVRMEAARALGRIGPSAREAIPALTAAARDSELLVSREARTALQAIGN